MYFSLGHILIQPPRQKVDESMPNTIEETFPSIQCIPDCTKIVFERPSSPKIHSSHPLPSQLIIPTLAPHNS